MRWSCDHQRTLSSRRLLVTEQANSRRSTQGRTQERAYERKEVPSSNEGKKERLLDKQISSPRYRSQSRSTSSAVLEDTMHLVDLFLSAFAPSWIAKGSMRSIDLDDDRTSGRAAQVLGGRMHTWPSGALRAITVGAEMRDRVFLQGLVTVVAILFRSVLTAHALFHTNEDPMLVLMLNPPPPKKKKNIDQVSELPVVVFVLTRPCRGLQTFLASSCHLLFR